MTHLKGLTELVKERAIENAQNAMNIYSDLETLQKQMGEAGAIHLITSPAMLRAMATAKNIEIGNRNISDSL